jgi:transposase
MIVIGVDVHKHSLTAVAVDEVGRAVAELGAGGLGELVDWSVSLAPERLWAVEDCRQLTGALERRLLAAGESLVRLPPKLMAPERRRRACPWQIGSDRRTRRRQSCPARIAARSSAAG